MIVFAISLRAKETTNNWERCLENFNATIKSSFNQTEPEFHCIVACNEIPKLDKRYDERLEFIKVDTPIPRACLKNKNCTKRMFYFPFS